jgi:hypothetical protein
MFAISPGTYDDLIIANNDNYYNKDFSKNIFTLDNPHDSQLLFSLKHQLPCPCDGVISYILLPGHITTTNRFYFPVLDIPPPGC